jgi:hypothetical protein
MITGWKKLSKKELAHLKEQGIHTNWDWQQTLKKQAEFRALGGSEPCWDCREIAEKLGQPVS